MQPKKLGVLATNEIQATQNYPKHVPAQVVERNLGTCMQILSPDMTYAASIIQQVGEAHGNSKFRNSNASATTEQHSNMSRSAINQSLPTFHPSICNNQETYPTVLNISSTFSSLIVSTLLQNPAAHAVASIAASFLLCTNVEISVDSHAGTLGGFPSRHMSPSPVYRDHCCHYSSSCKCMVSGSWAIALMSSSSHWLYLYSCTHSCNTINRLSPVSPSDSKGRTVARLNETGLNAADHDQKPMAIIELHDSNSQKIRKQVHHSSCGSNTASSSEVETGTLEKQENGKEELKDNSAGTTGLSSTLLQRDTATEFFTSTCSEEYQENNIEDRKQKSNVKDEEDTLQLDLNSRTWVTCPNDPGGGEDHLFRDCSNLEKGLFIMGLEHGKPKAHWGGFKPYKR
ncbi:hypothetical protein HHK36_027357 [Tetracentron sinense]|uniref:Uncharacterized protein n=1 Tax=Tetracentron sinense TaxID=13715 RepID=A0A834YHE0_TETSI|nr:hypothetical protein HHK36_027357 [Tetracentron sinense]